MKPISSLLILHQQDDRSGCLLKRFVVLFKLILDVKLTDDVKKKKTKEPRDQRKTTKPQNEQTKQRKNNPASYCCKFKIVAANFQNESPQIQKIDVAVKLKANIKTSKVCAH